MKNDSVKNTPAGKQQPGNTAKNTQGQKDIAKDPSAKNDDKLSKDNRSQADAEHSNIRVDNEGKIGEAHGWPQKDEKKKQSQGSTGKQTEQKNSPDVKSDKTKTDPEIDAPIYDPEKTEKKIPKMKSDSDAETDVAF